MAAALVPAFADPVLEAQATFRAVMDALARPCRPRALPVALTPPAPLAPEAAAIALTLADHETTLWLDAGLDLPAVRDWLRFHTGARLVAGPGEATFALSRDAAHLPPFDAFAQGEPDYPDRSTTLIAPVASFSGLRRLTFAGPGIDGTAGFAPEGLPAEFPERWRANAGRFPLGVDLILVAPGQVAGLPRSARLVEED